jgi:hypothetical protein
MSLAERIAQVTYGKSADPDAPENQGIDFQDGFATGFEAQTKLAPPYRVSDEITREFKRRGLYLKSDASFDEWKRGFWSGVFTQIDQTISGQTISISYHPKDRNKREKNEMARIEEPGKFEGEAMYTPYFYDLALDGGSDETIHIDNCAYDIFEISKDDIDRYPELDGIDRVAIYERDDGFVMSMILTESQYADLLQDSQTDDDDE